MWVVNRHDGTLARIDPVTNTVVGDASASAATRPRSRWGRAPSGSRAERRGPSRASTRTGRARSKRLKTGSSPAAIAVAGGSVWAAADAPQAAHRGGTLRALLPHAPGRLVPMDWLHWPAYTTWGTSQLSSLAYDGLVALPARRGPRRRDARRRARHDARRHRATTGSTYVFTLRRGLRFSDGSPVRPTDLRASMERFLQATRDRRRRPASRRSSRASSAPRGACAGGRSATSSRGIQTDVRRGRSRSISAARTRTSCTSWRCRSRSWCPPTAPAARRRAARRPAPARTASPPGTRSEAGRSSATATSGRPPRARFGPGFADRIEVRLYSEPTTERQIAAVQRGDADVTVVANPFNSAVTQEPHPRAGRPVAGAAAQRPSADHGLDVPQRAPARRSTTLACARRSTSRSTGTAWSSWRAGSEVGAGHLPDRADGLPRLRAVLPVHGQPCARRGWTAPDLGRARRLVAASGRAGERVVIRHAGLQGAASAATTRSCCDQLGFRPTLRIQSWITSTTATTRTRGPHTGLVQWGADYLAAANFIQPNFACARGSQNLSRLCDAELDRRIDRALRAARRRRRQHGLPPTAAS